jgi:hypothetical protein
MSLDYIKVRQTFLKDELHVSLSTSHYGFVLLLGHGEHYPSQYKTNRLTFKRLDIHVDPCIVHDSVEIPTKCSFVIEFIIQKFIEGSTCSEQHTAHHQELYTVFVASGLYTHVMTDRCRG